VGGGFLDCGEAGLHGSDSQRLVKKAEVDSGRRNGIPTEVTERLKALERENRELRQANEILRKASAYFAQAELGRRFKP
jgi:transposase